MRRNCKMTKSTITYEEYFDKILGGWLGKSIGGTIGAPCEAHKILGDMTVDNCWPEKIYPNDDLDIQVVWLEMLEERGPEFTRDDLVGFWQDRCWYNFAEYGFFLYNVQRGINPPLSGRFNNIFYRESMGCPIRAEIWGMVSPGNRDLAAKYAKMDGELDHIDNSVWAEQFWAACISEAFFASSLEDAFAGGKAVVPENSDIFSISCEVPQLLGCHKDWRKVWKKLVRKWGHRDGSKVEINFAFTLLALHAGKGNFKETIVIANNCGWDTDCTAATAGALLGTMAGAHKIPADWKEKMGEHLTCDVNVRHKTSLLSEFAEDTCKVGVEVALTVNPMVQIENVPESILKEAKQRKESRQAPSAVTMEAFYPHEPVLYNERPTEVILHIHYSGKSPCQGELAIDVPKSQGITVSPRKLQLSLLPEKNQEITLTIQRNTNEDILWDKNLFRACLESEDGRVFNYTFGLGGSRQWKVYGPYWDAWDTTKWDVCPYRNDEIISHPVFVEGCQPLLTHEYVGLDREYLNESELVKRDLPEEDPYVVERGENHIDVQHLGGFIGESCYYLVREIASKEPVECNVVLGSTGPFVVWMDGQEALRNESSSAWFFQDYTFSAKFDQKPKRIVIKCLRPDDRFRFSMGFMKKNVKGDKTVGVSYLIDSMGDIPK